MSEYEIHSLIADLFRDMDHMVEFWLSGTFAVIVARFYGADRLSGRVRGFIAFLYLVAACVAVARYTLVATRIADYVGELVLLGFEPFFQAIVPSVGMIVFLPILFAAGTVGTVYFALSNRVSMLAGPAKGEVT